METNKTNTVEMIRAIRDKNAAYLTGKSHIERIAFYRKQAGKMQINLSALQSMPQTEKVGNDNNQAG